MIRWTEDKKEFLKNNSKGRKYQELAVMFNAEFNENAKVTTIRSACKRYGYNNGVDCKFKKGQPAHNKGKKMPPEIYEKCKGTMFKKGSLPYNTYKVGDECCIDSEYLWVKVDDKRYAVKNQNWIQKQRLIYEQHYNVKLTSDDVIIFLDGDKTNFDIDNLKRVSRKENLYMNRNKLRFNDKDLTETGVNIAKLSIKTKELENQ